MSLIDDNWELLFEKYKIEQEVEKNELFFITSEQIREFKEARLMTKFDTKESLPIVFKNKLAILPVTRGKYVIGEFELYQDFPENKHTIKQISNIKIPDYFETIDINSITSEANAINVMGITSILNDFLQEPDMVQTISGRMSSGSFEFSVAGRRKGQIHNINVQNSQMEIDGGFENQNVVALIEGKNVVHNNFLIRQLYYPFRAWHAKISKPIRTVFMVYSNNIFRLLEYSFENAYNYNSISLVQEKYYSLEDVEITIDDLIEVHKKTIIKEEPNVTFVQADSFDKVISLIENLSENPMTTEEIAELFGFKERQSDYYYNAARYLGLTEKKRDSDNVKKVFITTEGKRILKLNYKKRQLEYVSLILEHQIFNEIFKIAISSGEIPDKGYISNRMHELRISCEKSIGRRASSVSGWIKWIINLCS